MDDRLNLLPLSTNGVINIHKVYYSVLEMTVEIKSGINISILYVRGIGKNADSAFFYKPGKFHAFIKKTHNLSS